MTPTDDTKRAIQLSYNLGHSAPLISETLAAELRNAVFPFQELLDECAQNEGGKPSIEAREGALHALKRILHVCRALESGILHEESANNNANLLTTLKT